MTLAGRHRPLRSLRVELATLICVLLIWGGWQLRERPLQRAPDTEPRQSAPALAPDTASPSDVLVLLPTPSRSSSLEHMAFDQAWLTSLEREIGTVRNAEVSTLSPSLPADVRWMVLPRRAAGQANEAQVDTLGAWVHNGGLLIIEQPEGPWRSLLGQNFGAASRPVRRITSFDGALTRGELRNDLIAMPFRTNLIPYNPPNLARGRDYQVLMEADGLPAIVALQHGDGHILLLLFDFGRLSTLMMQGFPDNSFLLPAPPDAAEAGEWTRARWSILDDELATNLIPFVDLLERNLVYLAQARSPLGRLWYYPHEWRGALVVTHTEAGVGALAEYITDWEFRQNASSTFFVHPATLSPEDLARFSRKGSSMQHLWYPSAHSDAPLREWRVGAFRPMLQPQPLRGQLERLNDGLNPYGPVLASRSVDGHWPSRWLDGHRILQEQGIVVSSSFGPLPTPRDGSFGYLFGTGRPFRPVDTNGHRFALLELPYQTTDLSGGYTLARLRRLLFDAAEKYHTTVVVDWRADTLMRRPSFDALEGWRNAWALAESQQLWTPTIPELTDFHFRRLGSSIRSTFNPETRTLRLDVAIPAAHFLHDGSDRDVPSIAFPVTHDGRPLESVHVNGEEASAVDLAMSADRLLHILPLPAGEHRIIAVYGSGGAPEVPLP